MTPEQEQVLEEGLCLYYRRTVRILKVEKRPFDFYGTHPIGRLLITLESGDQLPVIFKCILPELEENFDRREVLVYQKLLRGYRFGAPALYASLYDTANDRYWLFLEDLAGGTLDWGDTEDWYAAVRWMAGMHATYLDRDGELRALQCLDEHNTDYYRAIAEAARDNLRAVGAGCALERLDKWLAQFSFESLAEHLAGTSVVGARTLVHGDAFPSNLGLQDGSVIRPLDWGSAAIGPAVWDLARLLDGWGSAKSRFVSAYLDELVQLSNITLDQEAQQDFIFSFNHHCAILNSLRTLSLQQDMSTAEAEADSAMLLDKIEATWREMAGSAYG